MEQAPNGLTRSRSQFDLTTHPRDGKGKITSENHYLLHIENGVHTFERPPGSGYFYDSANNLIREPQEKNEAPKVEAKSEFINEDLAKQVQELKAQLEAQKVPVDVSPEEIETDDQVVITNKFNKPEFIKK